MILRLISLLVVAAVAVRYRTSKPSPGEPGFLVLCGALGLAVFGLLFSFRSGPDVSEAIRLTPYAAGAVLGQRIAADLEIRAPVLVVGSWRDDLENHPIADSFADGLRTGLGKADHGVEVRNIPTPPDAQYEGYLPSKKVVRLLQEQGEVAALVFWSVSPARPQKQWPPMYLMTTTDVQQEASPLPGYARAAVVFRDGVDWSERPDRSTPDQEIFDARYKLLVRE